MRITKNQTLSLKRHASTDSARMNLTAVYLDVARGDAVATDGHRLLCLDIEAPDPHAAPANLDAKALHAMVSTMPSGECSVAVVDERKVRLGGDTTVPQMETAYPDYRQVMPKDQGHQVSVNARYLKEACEAVLSTAKDATDKADRKDPTVRLCFRGHLDPIALRWDVSASRLMQHSAVIMPMRSEHKPMSATQRALAAVSQEKPAAQKKALQEALYALEAMEQKAA